MVSGVFVVGKKIKEALVAYPGKAEASLTVTLKAVGIVCWLAAR